MGDPSMQGVPAGSAAQHAEKSFPADTSPGEVAAAKGAAESADAAWREAGPREMPTPVQPEMRQVTPVADMGAGYVQGSEDDPW